MIDRDQSSPSPIAVVPTDTDDSWLDELAAAQEHHTNSGNHWRAAASPAWSQVKNSLMSTPGKMVMICLVLSVAILAAGFSISQSAAQRRAELDTLTNTTEPVSYVVQDLYSSLSVADTTATAGFISAGVEDSENRDFYGQAIQAASEALTQVAAELPAESTQELELVSEINQILPTYTGLVETAWANNRQGNPVGAAYMALASSVMQDQILPQAAQLHNLTSRAVLDDQKNLTRPMLLPISGLLAAVLFLLAAQWWFAQATRRIFNAGLLTATVLMTIASVWAVATSWVTWSSGTAAYSEAAEPIEQLTTARIAAQQTRSQETLSLVGRTNLDTGSQSFSRVIDDINTALDTYAETELAHEPQNTTNLMIAYDEVAQWEQEHNLLAMQLASGDYQSALENMLVTTDSPTATNNTFQQLDDALAALINSARGSLQSMVAHSSVASAILSRISSLAFVLSLLAIWIGVWPRLQEYRA